LPEILHQTWGFKVVQVNILIETYQRRTLVGMVTKIWEFDTKFVIILLI